MSDAGGSPGGDKHAALLAAIGRALGMDAPVREVPRDERPVKPPVARVLAGVVDEAPRDRVAWIEHTWWGDWTAEDDPEDLEDVTVNIAGAGLRDVPVVRATFGSRLNRPAAHVSVDLEDRRPDRVTGIVYMRFFPDRLVLLYRMALHVVACRLTLSRLGVDVHREALGTHCVVADDGWRPIAYHLTAGSPLVQALTLPALEPEVPMPVPRSEAAEPFPVEDLTVEGGGEAVTWSERLPGGRDGRSVRLRPPTVLQSGFPGDPEAVWERLRAGLGGSDHPADGPDVLIGAVATPFWAAALGAAGFRETTPLTQDGPWWFPAAWYRYLRAPRQEEGAADATGAAAWLAWLELLAGRQDDDGFAGWQPGWTREEGAARLALAHVRQQSGVLAAACRGNELPEASAPGWWLRWRGGTWAHPLPLSVFPAGFARAWKRLPARFFPGPASSPHR